MSNKLNQDIGLAPPFKRWNNYNFSVVIKSSVNKKKLKYFYGRRRRV